MLYSVYVRVLLLILPVVYVIVRLTPCQAAATPITSVPAIPIARGPLVHLNTAPAKNPERSGVTGCSSGVQASSVLKNMSNSSDTHINPPQTPQGVGDLSGERVITH